MTQQEAQEVFIALSKILEEVGLTWMLEQVRQEIAHGKTSTKTLNIFAEEFPDRSRQRRQRVRFVSTEEYDSEEQLYLLVDAMEQAVVASLEMQKGILALTELTGVRFVPDEGGQGLSITSDQISREVSVAEKLKATCEELRKELNRELGNAF